MYFIIKVLLIVAATQGYFTNAGVVVPADNSWNGVRRVPENGLDDAQNITGDTFNTVGSASDHIVNNAQYLGNQAHNGVDDLGGNLVDGTENVGYDLGSGVRNVGSNVISGAQNLGSNTMSGVENVGSSAVSRVESVGNTVINGAQNAGNYVINGAENVGGTVTNSTMDLGNTAVGGVTNLGNTAYGDTKNLGNDVWNMTDQAGGVVVGGMENVGGTVWNGTFSATDDILNGTDKVTGSVLNDTQDVSGTMVNTTGGLGSGLLNTTSGVVNGTKGFFGSIFHFGKKNQTTSTTNITSLTYTVLPAFQVVSSTFSKPCNCIEVCNSVVSQQVASVLLDKSKNLASAKIAASTIFNAALGTKSILKTTGISLLYSDYRNTNEMVPIGYSQPTFSLEAHQETESQKLPLIRLRNNQTGKNNPLEEDDNSNENLSTEDEEDNENLKGSTMDRGVGPINRDADWNSRSPGLQEGAINGTPMKQMNQPNTRQDSQYYPQQDSRRLFRQDSNHVNIDQQKGLRHDSYPVNIDQQQTFTQDSHPANVDKRVDFAQGNYPDNVDKRVDFAQGNYPDSVDKRGDFAHGNYPDNVDKRVNFAQENYPVDSNKREELRSNIQNTRQDSLNDMGTGRTGPRQAFGRDERNNGQIYKNMNQVDENRNKIRNSPDFSAGIQTIPTPCQVITASPATHTIKNYSSAPTGQVTSRVDDRHEKVSSFYTAHPSIAPHHSNRMEKWNSARSKLSSSLSLQSITSTSTSTESSKKSLFPWF